MFYPMEQETIDRLRDNFGVVVGGGSLPQFRINDIDEEDDGGDDEEDEE